MSFGSLYALGTANSTSAVGGICDSSGTVTSISSSNLPMLSYSTAPTIYCHHPSRCAGGLDRRDGDGNLNTFGQISGFNITSGGTGYNRALAAPTVSLAGGVTNTSITQSAGTLTVGGTTSITSTGAALLWRGNDLNNVVLNSSPGNVVINDVNNVSISGSAVGSVAVTAGASGAANIGTQPAGAPDQFAGPWALSLGNLNVGGLIATSGNGGGGNSGTLTQANGTKIHSETLTRFTTTNNTITVANPGNNFGRVEIFSNPGANVTINVTEDGTMKVGNVVGRGNSVTLTMPFRQHYRRLGGRRRHHQQRHAHGQLSDR